MADTKDLTMEHLTRVTKGRTKTARQLEKIAAAMAQLKLVEESPTYAVTPDQWATIFGFLNDEVAELQAHVDRMQQRQARGDRDQAQPRLAQVIDEGRAHQSATECPAPPGRRPPQGSWHSWPT